MECGMCGCVETVTHAELTQCAECGHVLQSTQTHTQELSGYEIGGNRRYLQTLDSTVLGDGKNAGKGRKGRRRERDKLMPWRLSELLEFVVLPRQVESLFHRTGVDNVQLKENVQQLMQLYMMRTGEAFISEDQRARSLWKNGWGEWHFPDEESVGERKEKTEKEVLQTLQEEERLRGIEFLPDDDPRSLSSGSSSSSLSSSSEEEGEGDSSSDSGPEDVDPQVAYAVKNRLTKGMSGRDYWQGELIRRRNYHLMEINVSLVYLGLLLQTQRQTALRWGCSVKQTRDPEAVLFLTDLLRLIALQQFPHICLWDMLPSEYKFRSRWLNKVLLRKTTPRFEVIRRIIYKMTQLLPVPVLPRFPIYSMARRFLNRLCLPRELLPMVKKVMSLWLEKEGSVTATNRHFSVFLNNDKDRPAWSCRDVECARVLDHPGLQLQTPPRETCPGCGGRDWVPAIPDCLGIETKRRAARPGVVAPDSFVLAHIVYVLRSVFGCDGSTERQLSEAATRLNSLQSSLHCFDLGRWLEAMERWQLSQPGGLQRCVRSSNDLDKVWGGVKPFVMPEIHHLAKADQRLAHKKYVNPWDRKETVDNLCRPLDEMCRELRRDQDIAEAPEDELESYQQHTLLHTTDPDEFLRRVDPGASQQDPFLDLQEIRRVLRQAPTLQGEGERLSTTNLLGPSAAGWSMRKLRCTFLKFLLHTVAQEFHTSSEVLLSELRSVESFVFMSGHMRNIAGDIHPEAGKVTHYSKLRVSEMRRSCVLE